MESKLAQEIAYSIGEEDTGLSIKVMEDYFLSMSNEDFIKKYGWLVNEETLREITKEKR